MGTATPLSADGRFVEVRWPIQSVGVIVSAVAAPISIVTCVDSASSQRRWRQKMAGQSSTEGGEFAEASRSVNSGKSRSKAATCSGPGEAVL